jgi:hypothetical protein
MPTLKFYGVRRNSPLGKEITGRMINIPCHRDDAVLDFFSDAPTYHDGRKGPYIRINTGLDVCDSDAIKIANTFIDLIDVDVISHDGLLAYQAKGGEFKWNAFEPGKIYIRVTEDEKGDWTVDTFPTGYGIFKGKDPEELIGEWATTIAGGFAIAKGLHHSFADPHINKKALGRMIAESSLAAHMQGQRHDISVKLWKEYRNRCDPSDIPNIPPYIPSSLLR